jgi:hypothetical protein
VVWIQSRRYHIHTVKRSRKAGSIRKKLAAKLALMFPEYYFIPEELTMNDPYHRSRMFDGISWQIYGIHKEIERREHRIFSWDTMTECVKYELVVQESNHSETELTANK